MEQIQEQVATEELPRCNTKRFSDRLCALVLDLHSKFNGKTAKHKVPVVISFQGQIPKPEKEDRRNLSNYFRSYNPKTFHYLENNGIKYLPLGFSSGEIVADTTIEQIDGLKDLEEIKEVDSAPNEFETYKRILIKHS